MTDTKQLEGRKIAVFDLEIKKRIDQCSNGWQSHDEMGISVLCMFDYETMRYRVFDDKNRDECLSILCTHEYVVGFNTVGFDWKVVRASWKDISILQTSKDYDILAHIWKAVGGFSKGYKLDDVAFDTLGRRKTANGELAPIMYQEGRFAELVDYCLEDVRLERQLFEFAITNGYVIRNGKQIAMPKLT